jgi:hypothetical protein
MEVIADTDADLRKTARYSETPQSPILQNHLVI